jgi:uncharacterized membrane protein SpoIIM required for sporulation
LIVASPDFFRSGEAALACGFGIDFDYFLIPFFSTQEGRKEKKILRNKIKIIIIIIFLFSLP